MKQTQREIEIEHSNIKLNKHAIRKKFTWIHLRLQWLFFIYIRNCLEMREQQDLSPRHGLQDTDGFPITSQPSLVPTQALFRIVFLLYIREKSFFNTKNMKENICTAQMSRRNTKCIKFVRQFLLNNSTLQKWRPKWYPKSYNVSKSLHNVQHQSTTF